MYLIISLIAFGLLVLGHEFGHFIMARINKVKVEEFSIGMGPRLYTIKGKKTDYSIKALPIGGSVQMYGETDDVDDVGSFFSLPPLRKISIIIAGPLMNIIMAVALLFIIVFNTGYTTNQINEVLDDSPAMEAGIESGDKILKVNGQRTYTFEDLSTYIAFNGDNDLSLLVSSGGKEKVINLKPELDETDRPLIGISPVIVENPKLFDSFRESFNKGRSLIGQTVFSLKILFSGKASMNDFGGPVTIFKMSSEVARLSLWALANFMAFLSINLAVLNLIPFPALDGGWILILLVELVRGKKLPERFVNAWNMFGFIVLMSFMLFVTFKDIFFPVSF